MFKSVLEISPEGYNVEQTNFYINNLLNKISFIDSAYNNFLERIKVLEAQNELLIKNNNMLNEILNKLNSIIENSGIASENDISDDDNSIEATEDICEETAEAVDETIIDTETENQNEDLNFLRDEINSLKSILKRN